MKSAQLFYSLYTATAALAAPVLPRLHLAALTRSHDEAVIDPSSSHPIGYKPPITVTIEGSRTIVLGPDYHRLALEEEGKDDKSAQVAIDNRPLVPSSSQNAQQPTLAVLSSARPLTTDHLQALSRLQSEQSQPQQEAVKPEPSRQLDMPVGSPVAPGSSPADGARNAQDKLVQTGNSPLPMRPQHGTRRSSPQDDAVVIGMVLVFLLITLLVVMRKPLSRMSVRPNGGSEGTFSLTLENRVRRLLGRGGAIYLREDKKMVDRRKSSFRDPDLEIPETTRVQGGEQGDESDEFEDSGAEPWGL